MEADAKYSFSAYSMESYEKYVGETEMDRSFVPYEKLSFLGEFASFHKGFPYYEYYFKAENGAQVWLELKTGFIMQTHYLDNSWMLEVDPPEQGSLLSLTAGAREDVDYFKEKTCFCMVDGVQFIYTWNSRVEDMVLSEIRWYSIEKASTYTIHLNTSYGDPVFTETAFESGFYAEITNLSTWPKARTRLMQATGDVLGDSEESSTDSTTDLPADDETVDVSTETATLTDAAPTDGTVDTPSTDGNAPDAPLTDGTDAASTDTPADPAPFPWVWVIVPAGVVLIAAAVTTALVINKKKKQ